MTIHFAKTRIRLSLATCLFVACLPASAAFVSYDLVAEKDSYVRSGSPTGNFGSASSAQVKRGDNSDHTRKAYLGFNLSGLPAGDILSAQLSFQFIDSGIGTIIPPVPEFDLFGLTDQLLDSWLESTITWNNAPANNTNPDNAPQLDPTRVESLASFSRSGKGLGQVSIGPSLALTDFLVSDTNGFVSFILISQTDANPGYVYAIGTKETSNPQMLKPTLRVDIETSQSIPEPGSLLLMLIGGLAALGVATRSSRGTFRPYRANEQ